MAYDLHIVRTKNWLEASSAPITKQDVDALIASDPELTWSTTDYVDVSDDAGAVARYYMITGAASRAFGGIETRFSVRARTKRSNRSSSRWRKHWTPSPSATTARFTARTVARHTSRRLHSASAWQVGSHGCARSVDLLSSTTHCHLVWVTGCATLGVMSTQ